MLLNLTGFYYYGHRPLPPLHKDSPAFSIFFFTCNSRTFDLSIIPLASTNKNRFLQGPTAGRSQLTFHRPFKPLPFCSLVPQRRLANKIIRSLRWMLNVCVCWLFLTLNKIWEIRKESLFLSLKLWFSSSCLFWPKIEENEAWFTSQNPAFFSISMFRSSCPIHKIMEISRNIASFDDVDHL